MSLFVLPPPGEHDVLTLDDGRTLVATITYDIRDAATVGKPITVPCRTGRPLSFDLAALNGYAEGEVRVTLIGNPSVGRQTLEGTVVTYMPPEPGTGDRTVVVDYELEEILPPPSVGG